MKVSWKWITDRGCSIFWQLSRVCVNGRKRDDKALTGLRRKLAMNTHEIEQAVKEFWNEAPCESKHMQKLFNEDKGKYFNAFDKYFGGFIHGLSFLRILVI